MKRTFCIIGLLLAPFAHTGAAADGTIPLKTRPVLLAELPTAAERVGRLQARGMLELPDIRVNGLRLSQLSGLAWDDDDGVLYAISDKGGLFHLRPQFRDGRLVGLELLKAVPLREANGKPLKGRRADSEGLDILHARNGHRGDAELVVSFERFPRIVRYRTDGTVIDDYSLPAPLNDPRRYRDSNRMLESVCVDEKLGALTVPEVPLAGEPENRTRIFDLRGGAWSYTLAGPNRISAVECLGDGRLLVLEHVFGVFARSVTLRLATLAGDGTKGSTAAAETVALLDLAQGYQIDNFEGLARHQGNRFFMVSDNNDLFVQRTLLLYFEVVE